MEKFRKVVEMKVLAENLRKMEDQMMDRMKVGLERKSPQQMSRPVPEGTTATEGSAFDCSFSVSTGPFSAIDSVAINQTPPSRSAKRLRGPRYSSTKRFILLK
jgi:hypothetical protein